MVLTPVCIEIFQDAWSQLLCHCCWQGVCKLLYELCSLCLSLKIKSLCLGSLISIVRYYVGLLLLDLVIEKEMMQILWKRCSTVDKLTSLDGTVVSSVLFSLCGLLDPQG